LKGGGVLRVDCWRGGRRLQVEGRREGCRFWRRGGRRLREEPARRVQRFGGDERGG